MLIDDYKVHVPMIYVKNRYDKDGEPWLVGTDNHDKLRIENGQHIIYENWQTSESSKLYPKAPLEGYEICNGVEIEDWPGEIEIYVKMVPWDKAVEIYKKLDQEHEDYVKRIKKLFEDKKNE